MKKRSMDALNRVSKTEYEQVKGDTIVILDQVRSMHNVGSVFRTADAFGISRLLLCGITACPPHREIQKTALGATESVPWQYFEETTTALHFCKSNGYTLVAVEQVYESISLNNFQFDSSQKYAFVFGNEVEGVSEAALELCDLALEIPQTGTKHSLNISVSAGIVLWETIRGVK